MNSTDYGNFAQIGSLIFTIITFIYMIIVSRSKASDLRVTSLEKANGDQDAKIASIETRIQVLPTLEQSKTHQEAKMARMETELKALPRTDQMHGMEMLLAEMQGELKVVVERIKPIGATMERLQEFMTSTAAENLKNGRRPRADT